MAGRDDRETMSKLMKLGFEGVNAKLDDMKEDINDLKKANVNAWKEMNRQSTRTTKIETRLENCSELSRDGKDCPTTVKLEKVCKQQEKQKDRGVTMLGILLVLIVGAAGLVVDIVLRVIG